MAHRLRDVTIVETFVVYEGALSMSSAAGDWQEWRGEWQGFSSGEARGVREVTAHRVPFFGLHLA
jgi:hypothetical protein